MMRPTSLLLFFCLFIGACGDGGGISMTPEQRAAKERQRINSLVVPEIMKDEEWPFSSGSDATKQMANCFTDEFINTLGLSADELESIVEADPEGGIEGVLEYGGPEVGLSVLGCFQENAREIDVLRLWSNALLEE